MLRSLILCCLLLTAPFLCAIPTAQAQQEDEQLWLQLNATVPLSDQVRLTVEQIERFSDRQGGLYQTEFGALFSTRLNQNLEISAGYRHVGFHNNNRGAQEHRTRQQLSGNFGRFAFRLRLDERFHPEGSEIGFRMRPLLRYNLPLGPKDVALFASHESIYMPNSTRWGQRKGYERMRNILGIAMPLAKGLRTEIGYLNQFRVARGGSRAQMEHALSIQLMLNWVTGRR